MLWKNPATRAIRRWCSVAEKILVRSASSNKDWRTKRCKVVATCPSMGSANRLRNVRRVSQSYNPWANFLLFIRFIMLYPFDLISTDQHRSCNPSLFSHAGVCFEVACHLCVLLIRHCTVCFYHSRMRFETSSDEINDFNSFVPIERIIVLLNSNYTFF